MRAIKLLPVKAHKAQRGVSTQEKRRHRLFQNRPPSLMSQFDHKMVSFQLKTAVNSLFCLNSSLKRNGAATNKICVMQMQANKGHEMNQKLNNDGECMCCSDHDQSHEREHNPSSCQCLQRDHSKKSVIFNMWVQAQFPFGCKDRDAIFFMKTKSVEQLAITIMSMSNVTVKLKHGPQRIKNWS